MERIYLDYNATAPLSSEVKDFFVQELNAYANGSSLHQDGRFVANHIEKARNQIANLIGATNADGTLAGEIIFTSGGSESNNTVFNTMIDYAKKIGKNTIVTSAIEHPCVIESARHLASLGFEVIFLPVDEHGIVKMQSYKDALCKKPLLVSVMTANNEIGTIQDIKTLCKLAHEAGALFHTDAVQAVGKIAVSALDTQVDYMTVSGHKLYAPKGIGCLYVKKGAPFTPLIRGGHQEKGFRAGTYNGPAIAAFGYAAEQAQKNLSFFETTLRPLRNMLRDGLLEKIANIKINGHAEQVLPNTLDVSFPGAEGEAILLHLDLLGIAVSTGSACASGSLEPSHVLLATGLGPELAHGSIRFSLGKYTTQQEIEYVLQVLPPVIEKLRKMSTIYVK